MSAAEAREAPALAPAPAYDEIAAVLVAEAERLERQPEPIPDEAAAP